MGREITEKDGQQFNLRLALIQKCMRNYLERYLKANKLPLRSDVIDETFLMLTSGSPPPVTMEDLVHQYVDILAGNEHAIKLYKVAMAIKVMAMTSSTMNSDAMKILRQLNKYRIHVMQLDFAIPDFFEFIDFVDRSIAIIDRMVIPVAQISDTPAFIDAGRYKILELLGQGGFGTVHKAQDSRLQRSVAVKHLSHKSGLPHEKSCIRQLHREAMSIAGFSHANIIQVHDFLEDESGCYIVMEYADGGSLAQFLDKERFHTFDFRWKLHFFEQIADALTCAHRRGIVHRDVKPANILLTSDQRPIPKLTDFGISSSIGMAATPSGTPLYMAPEQRLAGQIAAKPEADIYAFGKVVWECLTGEIGLAVSGEHEAVSPGLTSVIMKATSIDPESRYQTIEEMINAIVMEWGN
jgi:hypothetical protein